MSDIAESLRENKVIEETHTIRVLAEHNGLLISLTTKKYSYLLFLSRPLRAGYDIRRTRDLIDELYGAGGL